MSNSVEIGCRVAGIQENRIAFIAKPRQARREDGTDQLDKEASQTRDYCVAKRDASRGSPRSSLRKERLLGMTIKLSHYREDENLHVIHLAVTSA
jgi:hypothetical protein